MARLGGPEAGKKASRWEYWDEAGSANEPAGAEWDRGEHRPKPNRERKSNEGDAAQYLPSNPPKPPTPLLAPLLPPQKKKRCLDYTGRLTLWPNLSISPAAQASLDPLAQAPRIPFPAYLHLPVSSILSSLLMRKPFLYFTFTFRSACTRTFSVLFTIMPLRPKCFAGCSPQTR